MSQNPNPAIPTITISAFHNSSDQVDIGTHFVNTPGAQNQGEAKVDEIDEDPKPTSPDGIAVANHLTEKKITVEQFLDPLYIQLAKSTRSERFAEELFKLEALTKDQHDKAIAKDGDQDRNNFLYDIIFPRNNINECIVALEKSGNADVIATLKEKIL